MSTTGASILLYLPQTLGNNFSTLGKNSEVFLGGGEGKENFKGNKKKINIYIDKNNMKYKDIKKEFIGKDLWGLAFWRQKNHSLHIDGRGFVDVGKGSVAFWGEAGEGCILSKQAWLLSRLIMQLPPPQNCDDLYAILNWFSEDETSLCNKQHRHFIDWIIINGSLSHDKYIQ